MTSSHTVTHSDRSQKGTPRVYFDGQHDWRDAYYIKDCDMPPMGAVIEIKSHSWRPPRGKDDMWFLDDWRLAKEQPPPTEGAATVAASKEVTRTREQTAQDDMVLRFVSNAVGSAIECGRIEKPENIQPWATAALRAAQSVLARTEVEGDDIPF